MADEHRHERSGDRRSPWTDPHFLVPLVIQAGLWLIAVTSIILTDRLAIGGLKETIAELRGQITSLQSLATVTTEQRGDIKAIKDRLDKLENFESTQREAYNFNFTTRLANVEARVGIPNGKHPKDGE